MESTQRASDLLPDAQTQAFIELRRRIRAAEILPATLEKLLQLINFTGKLTIVVQNGRVLKCGYEEGYFRSRR